MNNCDSRLKTPKDIVLMSILLGVFIDLGCIMVYLFPSVGGGTDTGGVLGISYFLITFFLLVLSIKNKTFSLKRKNKMTWITIVGILFFYYYSILEYPEPRTVFNKFFFFTIVAFFIPSITKVDTRIFLITSMICSVPAMFKYQQIFMPLFIGDMVLSMGYCYSFLPPIVASITYFHFFLKKDKGAIRYLNIAAFSINIVYFYFLAALGSRGPVVAVLLLLVIPYLIEIQDDMTGVSIRRKKVALLSIFFVFFLLNFVPVLTFVQSILSDYGISLHFIDKFIYRSDAGDITSNRSDIFYLAIEGFCRNPLFGNGFDQFCNNTCWAYPHNFFSQILYDGGIYLFSITLLPVIVCFKKWWVECDYNSFVIVVTLFFASVPGALFSRDLWEIGELWLFFGTCLNYDKFSI